MAIITRYYQAADGCQYQTELTYAKDAQTRGYYAAAWRVEATDRGGYYSVRTAVHGSLYRPLMLVQAALASAKAQARAVEEFEKFVSDYFARTVKAEATPATLEELASATAKADQGGAEC